jgi:predicted nucleic acid-binding protein
MIKAKRLSAEMATSIFAALVESLKAYEREPMPDDVFTIVSEHGITGYDAQFVALARELHCPLYTQDKELLDKFPDCAKPYYRVKKA